VISSKTFSSNAHALATAAVTKRVDELCFVAILTRHTAKEGRRGRIQAKFAN